MTLYTYDSATKRLTPVPRVSRVAGAWVANYVPEGAHPKAADPAPPSQEGKVPVSDGYALSGGAWTRQWKLVDAPVPETFSVATVDDIADTVKSLAEGAGMVEASEGDE